MKELSVDKRHCAEASSVSSKVLEDTLAILYRLNS